MRQALNQWSDGLDRTVRNSTRVPGCRASGLDCPSRMLLDRKEVFAQTSPTAASYTTTVEGRYELGQHLVECEITSAARPLGRYVAGVKYTIVSDGRAAIVDGVPTELRPGERLRLSISLAAEAGR